LHGVETDPFRNQKLLQSEGCGSFFVVEIMQTAGGALVIHRFLLDISVANQKPTASGRWGSTW
jgi:hypothetical protein